MARSCADRGRVGQHFVTAPRVPPAPSLATLRLKRRRLRASTGSIDGRGPVRHTFVMAAQLPWPDDAPAGRRAGRARPGRALRGAGAAGRARSARSRRSARRSAARCRAAPGEEVAVELATGQRPAGTIDWVAGGEAGIRFKQPIDMLALAQPQAGQPAGRAADDAARRAALRRRDEVGRQPRRRDAAQHLRARACRSKATDLPPRDSFVSLFIDGLDRSAGEVVWRKGNLAGIELMDELSWSLDHAVDPRGRAARRLRSAL